MTAWIFYERTVPTKPMVPLSLFSNRTTSFALLGTFAIGVSSSQASMCKNTFR
jgi:hypothetical protein